MVEVRVDESVTVADGGEVWSVYDPVFGDQPDLVTWRDAVWDRHTTRDGFRLARAYDDAGTPVGFAYGYTGRHGQWWTDRVRATLPAEVAATWLDGHFELVSLGVLPGARGHGTGRALMRALLDGLPHDRLLLMTTADADDPARRLYASEGWHELGPGTGAGTVVMGRRPLADLGHPVTLDDGAGVSLRLARETDAEMLTAWLADPAVHRGWGGRPLSLAEVREKYTGARFPDVVSYVVGRDGTPCGYLQAWRADGRRGLDLFVAAHAQGRGTGPRAAKLLARRLDELGWRPLTVDPDRDDPAAVAMWTSVGFTRTDQDAGDGGTVLMTWRPR